MNQGALEVVGGLGLFLLGMFVLTSGLKQLAGRSLRSSLRRFTKSPTSGAASGAVATALIQSSSATTVTAVGFVGAGLMTFAEALGIIFGANIGTTITGWFVALFGFKVPLGTFAYPFVLVGAMGRLLGRGRWASVGEAVAGFGLIFVGIDLLQSGLAGLEGTVTPESFPPNTWFGRMQLVGIGVLITLVTQSSSAGVAMALASVNAGTITFPQAAAIVIGMDIGTTVTAAMAVVGGGTQVKRTGLAHVIYNCLTGIGAYFLLVPYVEAIERFGPGTLESQPEILLVGFHTLFNGIGVLAVLPFAGRFAALVERIIPEPGDEPTHALGQSLLADADAALDVVETTLRTITGRSLSLLATMWQAGRHDVRTDNTIADLEQAVTRTRDFAIEIASHDAGGALLARHQAAIHVIDHLDRLLRRLRYAERLRTSTQDAELRAKGEAMVVTAEALVAWVNDAGPPVTETAERVAADLVAEVRPYRAHVIERAVGGRGDPSVVDAQLDAIRWMARLANHIWRLSLYLEELSEPSTEAVAAETEPDI